MKPSTHARIAAAIFAAQACFPILHRATGGRYAGFTFVHDVIVDTGLAAIWLAAVLAGVMHRPPRAWFVLIAGMGLSVIHGIMYSIATSVDGPRGAGIPFLVAAVVEGYFVANAAPAFRSRRAQREHEAAMKPHHRWS